MLNRHPMPLPDGHEALVTGRPDHWVGPLQPGSATRICLDWILGEFGKTLASNGEALALSDVEAELLQAGIAVASDPADSLEDLAQQVELGRTILLVANAGQLWNSADAFEHAEPNHPMLVNAIAQDPESGLLLGAYLRDPSAAAPQFLLSADLESGWLKPGGVMLAAWEAENELFLPNL